MKNTRIQARPNAIRARCLCIPIAVVFIALLCASNVQALDPNKTLAQYSRTVWTQAQGLHQETIRAIAQTKDGYLWLATDEGLVRFDGYYFLIFNKANSDLPDDSMTALAASSDGSL